MPLLDTCRAAAPLIAAAAVLAPTLDAAAQDETASQEQRTWLQLQVVNATIHSSARFDDFFSSSDPTLLQLEDELGLRRRKAVAALSFGRRIGSRGRFEIDYFTAGRAGSAVLTHDAVIDYDTYPAGTTLHSKVRIESLRVNGGVSIVHTDAAEFGVAFGGQWVGLARRISSQGPDGGYTYRDVAPALMVGLYGGQDLAPGLRLSARADVTLDGSYVNLSADLQWRLTPNFGLGAGWRYSDARTDQISGVFSGDRLVLNYRASGPMAYLQAGF